MMLWKPEESTYDTLFDRIEIKLLVSGNKSRIHEKFLESTREKFEKKFANLLIMISIKINIYKLRGLFKGSIKLDKQEKIF